MKITHVALAVTLCAGGLQAAEDEKRPATGASTQQQDQKERTSAAARTSSESQADTKILAKLHETNQMEIEFGKLAQKNGSSADVKDYGKQLVKDHQDADKKILSLAKEQSLKLESASGPMDSTDAKKTSEQKATLEKLKTLSGAQFDQEFLKAMTDGHQHALDLVKQNKGSVQDQKVKSLLSELEPVLEKHRQMAASGGHDHTKSEKTKSKTDASSSDRDDSRSREREGQTNPQQTQ